ncbi:hypothetical protein [Catellatospora sp. NPDC049133]
MTCLAALAHVMQASVDEVADGPVQLENTGYLMWTDEHRHLTWQG